MPTGAVFEVPLPKGWKLSTTDKRDGAWQVVTIEKKGFTNSGAVTVRWTSGILDLDSVAQELVRAFRRRGELHGLDTGPGTFQDKQAYRAAFTIFPILPFDVEIRTFHACEMTFVYINNVAQEDLRQRRTEMQGVEAGFRCK